MDFYYLPGSAPCRAVQMTAEAVGVELNLKYVNLMEGDHLKPEFIKINPQHSVPTLVDNGFVLWESRAIMAYLADKYGKDDSLYPKDPAKRALVNQRLYFDSGILGQRFADYYYPQIIGKGSPDEEKFKRVQEAVNFLNIFLDGKTYAAGNDITIADLSLLATISSYDAAGFELEKYPNVQKWFNNIKKVAPGAEINQKGIEEFKMYFQ